MNNQGEKSNLIVELTFDFALDVISFYKVLVSNKEFVISKQLLRSATSIGANVNEASGRPEPKRLHFKNGYSFERSERD